MDCLFCKIISGEIPSSTIYEDETVKVFLDINPTTNGDSLVVPKKHYKDFREVPDEILNHMNEVIKKLYPIYQERLNCEGLTLAQNNELGQEIKHFHIHLIPRYPEDHADFSYDKEKLSDLEEIYSNAVYKNGVNTNPSMENTIT